MFLSLLSLLRSVYPRLRTHVIVGLAVLSASTQASMFEEKIDLPSNDLNGNLLYQIIASEVALQHNEAGTAFQTYMSLARTTKDPRFAQRAFEIADNLHAYKQALEATELWLSLSPSSASAQSSYALVKLRQGDLSLANQQQLQNLLEKTANAEKRNQFLHQIVVQSEIGARDAQKALHFLSPFIGTAEHHGLIALALAKLYRRANEPHRAQHYAKRAYQDLPDNVTALLEYADGLTKSDLRIAVATIEAFVNKHPEELDARLGLAKAYAKSKQPQKTLEQIQHLEKRVPNNPAVIFTLAGIADTVNLPQETQQLLLKFEKLAEQNPQFEEKLPQTHLALGIGYYRQKNYEQAVDHFRKVPQNSDLYTDAKLLEAHCLASMKKTEQAIKLLDKITSNTKQIEIWQAQAKFADQLKRHKDSYRYLKKALDARPEDPTLLYHTAIAAEKIGRLDQAEALLQSGIDQFPNKPDFYNALGYLWADHNKNLDKAKRLLNKALKLSPNDPAILDSIGWLYFRQGELALAQKYLEKASEKSADVEILLHLAEVHYAQKQVPRTMDILRSLMKLYPKNEMIEQFMDRLHLHF